VEESGVCLITRPSSSPHAFSHSPTPELPAIARYVANHCTVSSNLVDQHDWS
jgi:hypothetical protein